MKTLVISKPTYTHILPLVEFPNDGDNFFIKESIDVLSSYGSIVALTLAKYGVDTNFTGAVGGDEISNIVLEIFKNNQVKIDHMERVFGQKTASSYKIYNQKTNRFTTITEAANKLGLTKFKYDFIPDVVVMDDRDYSANIAAINNYPNANLIFIGDKFTKDSSIYCNRCNYVISTLSFASGATGVTEGLNKPKNIVALFQKYIDLYNSKLIIKLDNFDLLYCVDDEVRLIKNVNKNIANKDSIYYSVLIYFLINNYSIENAIKLTNKAMLSSNNEVDLLQDIPDYKFIESAINEFNQIEANKKQIEKEQQILQNEVVIQQQLEQPITQQEQQFVVNQQTQQVEQSALNQSVQQPMETINQNINNNGVNNGQGL